MRAGKLDRRVVILRELETGRDEVNQPIIEWVAVATVWGQLAPDRGAERFEAQQLTGSENATFRIGYRGDVTVKDRVNCEGRTWDILSVREIGRRVGTEFDVTARAD
ncbi:MULTISPECIES: phage head closure protein [unclassified Ensifer]|uniref:phage head closure protein n=1 Tax=unclassified Ensifer TaxID=2633371 RepID=UPI00300FA65D